MHVHNIICLIRKQALHVWRYEQRIQQISDVYNYGAEQVVFAHNHIPHDIYVLVRDTYGNVEHVHLMDSGVYVVDVGRSQRGM